ncbi:MAG: cytochrome c maturation protein CcmE [Methylacidiphilales bacterium]|nr:cytochrome c maturation protein CcmE [Candidatus Methylacidiphilales bacterium]
MKARTKIRIRTIIVLVSVFAIGLGFILYSFTDNLMYFKTPTEVLEATTLKNQVRVGGMVVKGTVATSVQDNHVTFQITDYASVLAVSYSGILPDLFREGQGVVVVGRLSSNKIFEAETVLAKHDEKYVPREIEAMLKNQPKK